MGATRCAILLRVMRDLAPATTHDVFCPHPDQAAALPCQSYSPGMVLIYQRFDKEGEEAHDFGRPVVA